MRQLQKQFFYVEAIFGILALIIGAFFHFLYEWSGENFLIGLISPINESTWEHLKLLFFPVLFFTIFEYFYAGRFFSPFLTARTIGCLAGLFFIVTFFYTYTGILGEHLLWLDILTYFIGVALCYCITWNMTIRKKAGNRYTNVLSILTLLFLAYLFICFTKYPPAIPLFEEPTAALFPRC